MKKIESLTKKQTERLPEIAKEWVQRALVTQWDKEAAKDAVIECYKIANLESPTTVLLCDGPLEAIKEINNHFGNDEINWYLPADGAGSAGWRAKYWAFYEFFGLAEKLVPHFNLDKSGAFLWWWFKDMACLCGPPRYFRMDQTNPVRLHCADGPAIEWSDGTKLWFWKGLHAKEQWIMNPKSITRSQILNEKNVETRRILTEILGPELINVLKAKKLHVDDFGELYEIQDDLAEEKVRCVRVVCPSTGRYYLLRVPRETKTARGGLAWTAFLENEEDYSPVKET